MFLKIEQTFQGTVKSRKQKNITIFSPTFYFRAFSFRLCLS